MKTVVIFKWSRDPQDARTDVDGSVFWGAAKMAPTDDDPAAMEVAKAVASDGEIIGVTVGDGDPAWAAARGAASTVIVEGVTSNTDGTVVASAMSGAISTIADAGTVVIGDSEWDRAVVSALIGKLGLPAFVDVTAAERVDGKLHITCRGSEVSTIVEVEEPVLLAVKGLTSEKNVPGMKQTIMGRKKPKTILSAADVNMACSKVQSQGSRRPDREAGTIFSESDAEANVAQLVEALRSDGLL